LLQTAASLRTFFWLVICPEASSLVAFLGYSQGVMPNIDQNLSFHASISWAMSFPGNLAEYLTASHPLAFWKEGKIEAVAEDCSFPL
jgi:hypothetical protein